MLHFGVQLPYAALAYIQHEWDTNHLNVWVIFPHPMDQDFLPDHAVWACDVDNVIKAVTVSAWQDAFTILLTVPDILALPGRVLLEYLGPDGNLATTWNKQWEPWGPILSVNVPYEWRNILVVDVANRRVGINAAPLARTFEIASTDQVDRLQLFHDNTDGHFHWTDGWLLFQTEEGTNTDTQLVISGKGTSQGILRVRDGDDLVRFVLQAQPGGTINLIAGGPGALKFALIASGSVPVHLFSTSPSDKTQSFRIYGFRLGDVLRFLNIAVGSDRSDSVSFSGLSQYRFAGDLLCQSLATGTLTHSALGPTDDLDVSSVNTVFIDCSLNDVTIGAFLGGVNGQVLQIVKLCAAVNNVTLEHNEGTLNQNIFLHAGLDETLTGEYGGWTLVCNGSDWYDISHSKHV